LIAKQAPPGPDICSAHPWSLETVILVATPRSSHGYRPPGSGEDLEHILSNPRSHHLGLALLIWRGIERILSNRPILACPSRTGRKQQRAAYGRRGSRAAPSADLPHVDPSTAASFSIFLAMRPTRWRSGARASRTIRP